MVLSLLEDREGLHSVTPGATSAPRATEGTIAAAEAIRRRVEALALPHPRSSAAAVVTVSVGVAWSAARALGSPTDLMSAAARALYRAKEAGRNRVENELSEADVPHP